MPMKEKFSHLHVTAGVLIVQICIVYKMFMRAGLL